jgi:hypothetical protein
MRLNTVRKGGNMLSKAKIRNILVMGVLLTSSLVMTNTLAAKLETYHYQLHIVPTSKDSSQKFNMSLVCALGGGGTLVFNVGNGQSDQIKNLSLSGCRNADVTVNYLSADNQSTVLNCNNISGSLDPDSTQVTYNPQNNLNACSVETITGQSRGSRR